MSFKNQFKSNYWIKSGILSLFQNLLTVGFGFGSFYFLIRVLTKDQYGAWVLFLATVTILEFTRSGLLQNAMIKYIAGAKEADRQSVITTSLSINIVVSIIFSLLIIGIAPLLSNLWKTPELTSMLYLYLIAFFILGIQSFLNSIEQAFLNFKGLFFCSFINQVMMFGYVVTCYLTGIHIHLINLVYITIIGACMSIIPAWLYARKNLAAITSFRFDASWAKKLLNYGKYAMGTSVNALLSSTVDQMMLGAMLSPAAAGKFNIALRISNLANIPSNAMATIVFPQGSKRAETEGLTALKYLYEKSVGSILAILVPALLFIYLFATPIIHFIADEKYADAIPLLKITLLYSFFVPFSRQTGTILESIGKTKLNFYLVLCTAILNILLNFSFIKVWGVMGAAYATLITNVIFFLVSQYINHRLFKISVVRPWLFAVQFYPELYKKFFSSKKSNMEAPN